MLKKCTVSLNPYLSKSFVAFVAVKVPQKGKGGEIPGERGQKKCQQTKTGTNKCHKHDPGDSPYKPFIVTGSVACE